MRMFFTYDHLKFLYEPFPIGLAKPLMDADLYGEFVDQFPPVDTFDSHAAVGRPGKKYTLSERVNPKAYKAFVQSHPLWREFHRWIKSDEFVYGVIDMLRSHDIDLGYRQMPALTRVGKMLKGFVRGRRSPHLERLKARFEFSALPVDGGHVRPHTDLPSKIVTLVISMMRDSEWNPAFGGGTDVNRPREDSLRYNDLNRTADFEQMEVVHTFDYTPNQAVIFVKTYNSWHSVRPMTGLGHPDLRKTLTINIERL